MAPRIITPSPLPSSRANNMAEGRSLPKINRNDVMKATKETFVKPVVNKALSGFKSMNPLAMATNWAEANPVTRAAMDFKANLDDSRNERDLPNRARRAGAADDVMGWDELRRTGGMRNPFAANDNTPGGGGGGMDGFKLDAIVAGLQQVVAEVRSVRQSLVVVSRNTNLINNELKKTNFTLGRILEALNNMGSSKLEDTIEGRKGEKTEAEAGKPAGLIAELLALATTFIGGLATRFRGLISTVGMAFRAATAGIAARFTAFIRGINVAKMLEPISLAVRSLVGRVTTAFRALDIGKLMAPVIRTIRSIGTRMSGIAKALAPLTRLGGIAARLSGFLKFIPVIGQVIFAVVTLFDGIKGFIKGWNSTEGNFFEKAWAGLKGAVVSIVQGFIAPFKWLGGLIWKAVKGIGEALGIDRLVDSLKKIDFGAIWDKVVAAFKPAGSMMADLWDFFKNIIMRIVDKFAPTASKLVEGAINAGSAAATGARNLAAGARGAFQTAVDRTTGFIQRGEDQVGPGMQGLLDTIANGEGTSDTNARRNGYASGYDVTLGFGAYDPEGNNKPISQMTLGELDRFQTQMLRNPRNKHNSSAVGRYQIVRTTLRGLKRSMGLTDDMVFDQQLQDRLARELVRQRGGNRFLRGDISAKTFQNNLANEWASIATANTGRSAYGQATGTSTSEIQQAIAGFKEAPNATTRASTANPTWESVASPTTRAQAAQIANAERELAAAFGNNARSQNNTIIAPNNTARVQNTTNIVTNPPIRYGRVGVDYGRSFGNMK